MELEPILNVAAVARQDAAGGFGVRVGGCLLPVAYPDAQEASLIAGRIFDILQPGHEELWERRLRAAT